MIRDSASKTSNPRLDRRRTRNPDVAEVVTRYQPVAKQPGSKELTSQGWVEVKNADLG
jgi:hypothetical protein